MLIKNCCQLFLILLASDVVWITTGLAVVSHKTSDANSISIDEEKIEIERKGLLLDEESRVIAWEIRELRIKMIKPHHW